MCGDNSDIIFDVAEHKSTVQIKETKEQEE